MKGKKRVTTCTLQRTTIDTALARGPPASALLPRRRRRLALALGLALALALFPRRAHRARSLLLGETLLLVVRVLGVLARPLIGRLLLERKKKGERAESAHGPLRATRERERGRTHQVLERLCVRFELPAGRAARFAVRDEGGAREEELVGLGRLGELAQVGARDPAAAGWS